MYDVQDERGVPVSRGVPMLVRVAVVSGLLAIFAIGAFTVLLASYGHLWPWARTLRMHL